MFKFAKQREVLWPVKIKVPADGGDVETHEIKVRFKLLTHDDYQLMQDIGADNAKALDMLSAHVKGWEGVQDEDGNDLLFSPDNLAALLQVPYIERAITVGLLGASNGAAAKN